MSVELVTRIEQASAGPVCSYEAAGCHNYGALRDGALYELKGRHGRRCHRRYLLSDATPCLSRRTFLRHNSMSGLSSEQIFGFVPSRRLGC
jgi:hypothetical protein